MKEHPLSSAVAAVKEFLQNMNQNIIITIQDEKAVKCPQMIMAETIVEEMKMKAMAQGVAAIIS